MSRIIDTDIKINDDSSNSLILAFNSLPKYKQHFIILICGLTLFLTNLKLSIKTLFRKDI